MLLSDLMATAKISTAVTNRQGDITINNYWTRLRKISGFVSGEQINYLPKPKAEANH